jgi:dolichyl-diphosphooligosaccharide--protein glycosyltransferase
MTLSAIPAFFIAKRFGGNFAGFIASALLMIHPMALTRTIGGFSDTDSYNVLFPLLIVWVSIELFQSKNKINILLLSLLQGLLIGVYSFTWGSGWWYIFDFILATYIISIGYHFLNHIREIKKGIINFLKIPIIKKTLLLFVLFIFFSGIFVSLFSSFNVFIETPFQPFQFTKIKSIESIWPNVFLSIAEQVQIPFNKVKPMIGELLFMVSLIGALFLITKDTKKKNGLFIILASVGVIFITLIENITQLIILFSLPIIFRFVWSLINKEIKLRVSSSILIILWFVATLFAVEKGVRWLLLFAAPFSILVGIALGNLFKRLSAILTKSFDISKNVLRVSLILLLSLILISPFNESNNSASGTTPVMNDVWYSSLDKINKEASQDAIITSWWDYGHWFKSIGKRAVTFDGASQNTPDIHWVGKILTTTDEKEAIGTLRMVHCRKIMSFNKSDTICPGDGLICKVNAFIRLNGLLDETTKSIKILDEIMPLNKEEARNKLTNYLKDDEQINDMLEFTHCNPLENYFITSSDMIKKSGVWAHFGLWDFNKAQIYSTLNTPEYKDNKQSSLNYLSKKFNFTKEESETVYTQFISLSTNEDVDEWISPIPTYYSDFEDCSKLTNETFACKIGGGTGLLNTTTMDFSIGTTEGIKHPDTLLYPKDGKIIKKKYNNTIRYSIILVPTEQGYKNIAMSPELTESMFTRLYFLDGIGLNHFKKFSDKENLFGNRITIWKIDWEGSRTN